MKWVEEYPNLIVLRTFSKSAGLAGIRVGYGAFPLNMIAYIWKAKQPYNVSVASETAACAALTNKAYLQVPAARIGRRHAQVMSPTKVIVQIVRLSSPRKQGWNNRMVLLYRSLVSLTFLAWLTSCMNECFMVLPLHSNESGGCFEAGGMRGFEG